MRNIVLILKIFHRKFDIGLVGFRSGPKPPINLKLKKKVMQTQKKVIAKKS